jgi:hypothetical protein
MLLLTAALAGSAALDVHAWPSADEEPGHLNIALTTATLEPGITWVVDLHDGAVGRELACTRTQAGGMVCRFGDHVVRTDWNAVTRSGGFRLFAGVRADPSPGDERRAAKARRERDQPDPAPTVVVAPVEALVVSIPLDVLGPPGPLTVDARAVRRTWRTEAP